MKAQRRFVGIFALLVALVAASVLAVAFSNVRKGYAPRQPIAFNHARMTGRPQWVVNDKGERVNVGGFAVPCLYCHTMPYKGRHATIPSTAVCMNCHSTVGLNKEWVLRVKEYWDRGEPIPWVKVHDLPDFVYFDHSAHVNAKDTNGHSKLPLTNDRGEPMVVCQNCHGDVTRMNVVAVQNNFNMQWCLNCHRKPEIKASTDCVTCHR